MYINKALIFGNLTRDPELRALPSGGQVASFGVATNRVFRDKNGAKQEATEFHNVVVFGRQAETCSQYLRKGSSVFVEGRMQTRSWDTPDGTKKYRSEIVAERVQFGPRSGGSGSGGGEGGERPARTGSAGTADKTPQNSETIEYPEEEVNLEDIPF